MCVAPLPGACLKVNEKKTHTQAITQLYQRYEEKFHFKPVNEGLRFLLVFIHGVAHRLRTSTLC